MPVVCEIIVDKMAVESTVVSIAVANAIVFDTLVGCEAVVDDDFVATTVVLS